MSEQVVEPSEILIGKAKKHYAKLGRVNPWRRLIARVFDYSLFLSFLHLMAWMTGFSFTLPAFEKWVSLELLAWIPIETLLLWTWKKTPGKWLLRIILESKESKRISFKTALRRSFSVWLRGLGMGIQVLNVLSAMVAYFKVHTTGMTVWDQEEKILVFCRPIPPWRFYLALALSVIGCSWAVYWKGVLYG